MHRPHARVTHFTPSPSPPAACPFRSPTRDKASAAPWQSSPMTPRSSPRPANTRCSLLRSSSQPPMCSRTSLCSWVAKPPSAFPCSYKWSSEHRKWEWRGRRARKREEGAQIRPKSFRSPISIVGQLLCSSQQLWTGGRRESCIWAQLICVFCLYYGSSISYGSWT